MKNTKKNIVKNLLAKTILAVVTILIIGVLTGTESEAAGSNKTNTATKKVDKRVANYVATNPDYVNIEYEWKGTSGTTLSFTYGIDKSAFEYYASLERYWKHADYDKYIDDAYNHAIIEQIVDKFQKHQEEKGYSDAELIQNMAYFVQSAITYQTDTDGKGMREYPKYPIETLFTKTGDCEDTSILLAAMIKEAGFGSSLLAYEGHMAVGFLGSDKWEKPRYITEKGYYYYIETTGSGWEMGDMPEKYLKKPATIYFM